LADRVEDELVLASPAPVERRLAGAGPGGDAFRGQPDTAGGDLEAWLDRLDDQEMRQLVNEAWRMVVPKSVAAAHLAW
jgi:hypothetical protein